MTKTTMRELARQIGILNMQKNVIETEVKELKKELGKHVAASIPVSESATGNDQHVLEGVDGFTCKVYDKTQLFGNQKQARKLLHANTFSAIFRPSTFQVVDVRPTKATQAIAIPVLIDGLIKKAA